MKHELEFKYEFVESLPEVLKERTLYLCMDFATASHKCACGCGLEVVTPLSPTDWKFIYDGRTVTLHPSIGNWGFPCRSHYWIRGSRIEWSNIWSKQEIDANRSHDRSMKGQYFGEPTKALRGATTNAPALEDAQRKASAWQKIKMWWNR